MMNPREINRTPREIWGWDHLAKCFVSRFERMIWLQMVIPMLMRSSPNSELKRKIAEYNEELKTLRAEIAKGGADGNQAD